MLENIKDIWTSFYDIKYLLSHWIMLEETKNKKEEKNENQKERYKLLNLSTWFKLSDSIKDILRVICIFCIILIFDPMWPSSEFDRKIIRINILSHSHDDNLKNVTSRVLTRFSFDFSRWPNFWPQVTQYRSQPKEHQDKHFEQNSWW